MKKITNILILIFAISTFIFSILYTYEKSSVDKVFKYLSKKWYYHNYNGKKIKVKSLSWRSHGNNYELMVNGRSLNPAKVYDNHGINILNPSLKNKAKPQVVIGNENGILKGITEAHNVFRRKTGGGLPDLVWNEKIAAYSQEWANYLKKNNNCNMRHRQGSFRKRPYGENLAWSYNRELEPYDVVKMWYDEIKYYNYATNSCSGVCGHYTQVVWRNSKQVGCGMAKCGNAEVWVCNYNPPGNYVGQKPY
ncbi:MAG: pathogenesis-related family 1 protein [Spirochaetota bacterium]|nr:pathogenesis-related family 1 protein [Spirochaetota bacterium]